MSYHLGDANAFGIQAATVTRSPSAPTAVAAAASSSTLLILGALGLAGYLIYRHMKKGSETVTVEHSDEPAT